MTRTTKLARLEEEDIRLARSIAGFKGITLKEYLGRKIREDVRDSPLREFLSCGPFEPEQRRRRQ